MRILRVLVIVGALIGAPAAAPLVSADEPAIAEAPALTGEDFVAHSGFLGTVGTIEIEADCNAAGGQPIIDYEATGPANGPYPGTYEEVGSATLAFPTTTVPAPVLSFQAAFTIYSPIGVISGTKHLDPDGLSPNIGRCQTSLGVGFHSFSAWTIFEATLTTHTGETCSMTGTTLVFVNQQDAPTQPQVAFGNFQEFFGPSTTCVLTGGNASAGAAVCRNGGYLRFTDTAGTPFSNEGACVSYVARGGLLFTRL